MTPAKVNLLVFLNVVQLIFLGYKFNYSRQIDRDVLRLEAKVEAQSTALLAEIKTRTEAIHANADRRYE